MRLMSPSAQVLASIIGIPPPALAYMIGIGLRHLLVALITGGWRPLTSLSLMLRIFLVDMKVRLTIGYLEVCVKRVKAPTIASHPPDSCVTESSFDLTGERRCSLFIWGEGVLTSEEAGGGHVPPVCVVVFHAPGFCG